MPQNLQTLKGFRDFLPAQMAIRNRVKKILIDVFESFGFEPLSTPSLEYEEILLGKYGPEADKLVYTFEDRGGRRVGLPYDLTVPTARVMAAHSNILTLPFKRYQIQRVWRAENTQHGRYREIEQCDADILGVSSPLADAEILTIIYKIISRLGLGEFKIFLNSRSALYSLIANAGIPDELRETAAISIDKLDKNSTEEVTVEMIERGISKESANSLFEKARQLEEQFSSVEKLIEQEVPEELKPLQEIAKAAMQIGMGEGILVPKFTLARGLNYYTGSIFETVVTTPKIGSITGGGRYDNLISSLGGPQLSAVGTTIGLDRICDVIEELKLWEDIPVSPTQIFITIFSPELSQESIKLAKSLREAGLNTEIYLDPSSKLDKQLKYADKKNIPWAIILGPEEVQSGNVVLKNLRAKTQETIPWKDVAGRIR